MENNIITILKDNEKMEVEVLDIFSVVGYENKEYILYTMNEEVDDDNVKAYISILEQDGDNYVMKEITDEQELMDVENAVKEVG